MAAEDFKNIDTRTGFRILDKDRAIIERGKMESYFGRGKEDFIEFSIFDASDNQLPQGESGELTRHISLNRLNINEYFLVKDNGKDGGVEYFIDVEKIIREAGYEQGLFKIQYQLLNNRVGRYNTEKMFIHEIAPSRTEIRLVPVTDTDGKVDEELFKRYDGFTKGKTFRDDVIYLYDTFIDTIKVEEIITRFLNKYGAPYRDLILKEFKVTSFEGLIKRIVDKLKQAMQYFTEGKYFDPADQINYGKPNPNSDDTFLDVNELLKNILKITCDITDIELPKRNLQDETYLSMVMDDSVDVREEINTIRGDATFEPTVTIDEEDEEIDDDVRDDSVDDSDSGDTLTFLTVTPSQVDSGKKQGGTFTVDVNSSSRGAISISYNDGNGWISADRNSFNTGQTKVRFTYNSTGGGIVIDDDIIIREDEIVRDGLDDSFNPISIGPGNNDQDGFNPFTGGGGRGGGGGGARIQFDEQDGFMNPRESFNEY